MFEAFEYNTMNNPRQKKFENMLKRGKIRIVIHSHSPYENKNL